MTAPQKYSWSYILNIAREHKRELIAANIIALVAALASVPLPLLMPLLVDQVLLEKPGSLTTLIDGFFPDSLHQPGLYIITISIVTVCLRMFSVLLNVWQARNFSLVSKDVVYRIRQQMLDRLSRIAMSEYETLGSGTVTSHFITGFKCY